MSKELELKTVLSFNKGNEKAFKLVFKAHYPALVMFASKITGSKEEGEDIVTETFVKLFRLCSQFETAQNIKAFLYITARNQCLNYLKYKERRGFGNIELVEQMQDNNLLDYEYLTMKAEIVEAIYAAIENLPEECRKIFKMLYYEEMKPAEVARVLQISVNTVYVQKSRAVGALRLKFSENPLVIAWFIQTMILLQMDISST